jgi:precorrin-2 dehydrogenase/sirohydrochlorin ferrochelatase
MPKYYPMMVDLTGRRCLVVGGGRVAERKVALLIECEANVEVVSPAITPKLAALASTGAIRLARRAVRSEDLPGAFLIFVATDDPEINQAVATEAREAGSLVNVSDAPESCGFLVPSVVRRGDLTISISTGGGSPALAKRIRQKLDEAIGPEYEAFLKALRELRTQAQKAISDPAERQAVFRRAMDSELFGHAARGDRAAVKACIGNLLLRQDTGRARRS